MSRRRGLGARLRGCDPRPLVLIAPSSFQRAERRSDFPDVPSVSVLTTEKPLLFKVVVDGFRA